MVWRLQHTYILVFLVIERLFIYHKYPSRFSSLSALFVFAVVYQLWSVLKDVLLALGLQKLL